MDIIGVPLGLGVLMFLAYRGWSVLLLAPGAAMLVALTAGEPILAHWTQTFMGAAARFVAQFFPIFLLGALFGKLMDESGSIRVIAGFLRDRLGKRNAVLAVVLVGAIVTYGGVSLTVSFFVVGPMAMALFREADIPRRLMPAAIGLGTFTFTMSAMPGTPAVQNAIPIPYFGTTPFAAPGLSLIASAIIIVFGLWWIGRAIAAARRAGEGFGPVAEDEDVGGIAQSTRVREVATVGSDFDPAEMRERHVAESGPPLSLALLPLAIVLAVNAAMSLAILPGIDASFLGETRWGPTSLARVGGVWSIVTALAVAIVAVLVINWPRLESLRDSVDAGANASVLPTLSIASLVGFGAVVAALPAFATVRDLVLSIEGGPLVSLAASVNTLAAMTGSASGGLSIALNALGENYMRLAVEQGLSPDLLHRVAVMSAGSLDSLPHNGAVITLLAVCGTTHRESYMNLAVTLIAGPLLALAAVIMLGGMFGAF